jgi:type II secretory pathway pseudopilin PulG
MKGRSSPVLITLLLAAVALLALGLPHFMNQSEQRRQAQTLENMRRLASAIERYHLKNGRYPEADDGKSLIAQVELPYPPALESRDGWDTAMEIHSEAAGYLFVSRGADGIPDDDTAKLLNAARAGFAAVQPPPRVKTRCYENDLVFTMGLALKYPDGKQQRCGK